MNTPQRPGHDDDLTPAERRLVEDYARASQAAGETPAPAVRSSVLAAAAHATRARPARMRAPLALAASLVLTTVAVLIATRVNDEQASRPAEAPMKENAPAAESPGITAGPAREPAAAKPAPPTTSEPVSEPARAPVQAEAAAPAADATNLALPAPSAPAAASIPAAAPSPPPALRQEASPLMRERATKHAESRGAPAPARPDETDPAAWVERIVALRAAGRDVEADEEIRRLRERHPDIELPPAAWRAPAPPRAITP